MFAFAIIFASFVYISSRQRMVNAQSPATFGSCPDHPTVNEFDLQRGTWYEIERSFYVFELWGRCPTFNFTLTGDNNLDVKFSMKNRITGNTNYFDGTAHPNYENSAIWDYRVKTSLPKYLARMMPGSGKYLILYTDYDNYAIMWSCSNLGLFYTDLLWISSRNKSITPDARLILYSILSDLHFDADRLILSKQAGC